tara:strand:- start:1175 stop:2260 length:1086 start_codon:yes stop_codon:yes gene_type:complete
MKNKIGYTFLIISLFCTLLYGFDKLTSDNPADASLIRIGLSDIDSSSCKVCELNEIYYDSGCKRCIQDGVVLTSHVSNERLYNLGWSNDDGMYYGDNQCDGSKSFENTFSTINDTYYIEIIKNEQFLETNFYTDENFSSLQESVSIEMCSNPTNLKYIRISNEDGKPAGDGGKLYGYIDDIEILDNYNKKPTTIFSSSFNECIDKTCSNLWKFHNPEKIFIDIENDYLSFYSEVMGTNDYAHLKLDEELSDSWLMKFKFHINELEEHPHGKGILKLDPDIRQIILGIPALIFPFISYGITRKTKSNYFGIMMIITGLLILGSILFNFNQINLSMTNLSIGISIISVLIIILGILKIKVRKK